MRRARLNRPPGRTRRLGRYSRDKSIVNVDYRTRKGMFMRKVREELTAHCGGNPSAVQRALIERAVILSLKVAQFDARIIANEPLGLRDSNYALAWNNALRRTVAALGVQP